MARGASAGKAELEERIWEELRQCYDPEIPVNIVELGLVYKVACESMPAGGYKVEVVMTVTSPACGMSEVLRTEAETRIRQLDGVSEVQATVTFDPPWTPEMMTEDARLILDM